MRVKVNGIKLWYEKVGRGMPIILLHGNGEDHSIFNELANVLADYYTVYLLDSRGHGKSQKVKDFQYDEMAEDLAEFILEKKIKTPIVCGFSDGGIIGLLTAIKYPDLLSKLIICGANTNPAGLKGKFRMLYKLQYGITHSKLIKLMLTQPNITKEQLSQIRIPTLVLAGQKDIISKDHTKYIAQNIPLSKLKILKGETHASYVVHTDKIYEILESFLKKRFRKI